MHTNEELIRHRQQQIDQMGANITHFWGCHFLGLIEQRRDDSVQKIVTTKFFSDSFFEIVNKTWWKSMYTFIAYISSPHPPFNGQEHAGSDSLKL